MVIQSLFVFFLVPITSRRIQCTLLLCLRVSKWDMFGVTPSIRAISEVCFLLLLVYFTRHNFATNNVPHIGAKKAMRARLPHPALLPARLFCSTLWENCSWFRWCSMVERFKFKFYIQIRMQNVDPVIRVVFRDGGEIERFCVHIKLNYKAIDTFTSNSAFGTIKILINEKLSL